MRPLGTLAGMGREAGAGVESRAGVARRSRGPHGEVLAPDLGRQFGREHALGVAVDGFGQGADEQALVAALALLAEQAHGADEALLLEGAALRIGDEQGRQAGAGAGTGRPSRSSASWP